MEADKLTAMLQPVTLTKAVAWKAGLIPIPDTPEAMKDLRTLLADWTRIISERHRLNGESFLQIWKMGAKGSGPVYANHIQRWLPVHGIGIWPGRRPPQRFTEEIAMDCAAAGLANEEPPLPSHTVAHVSASPEAAEHAALVMFGSEMVLRMWFPRDLHAGWAQRSQQVYQSTITDPLFQRERFYVPLFDVSLLEQSSDELLDEWTCGAVLYLREDPESKAVLLLCRYGFE